MARKRREIAAFTGEYHAGGAMRRNFRDAGPTRLPRATSTRTRKQ